MYFINFSEFVIFHKKKYYFIYIKNLINCYNKNIETMLFAYLIILSTQIKLILKLRINSRATSSCNRCDKISDFHETCCVLLYI